MSPVNVNDIRIVDEGMAMKLGEKKIGEIPAIGSVSQLGTFHIQSVNGELYWVAPLVHRDIIKWITNLDGTDGYVMVSATDPQDVRLVQSLDGKPIKIKYQPEDANKYGIINARYIEDNVYKVKDLVEKPEPGKQPSNIAILGRYIITPEIFEILENQAPGKGGEVQLTDALKTLSKKEAMYAYEFEGRRYDVGDKLGFLEATVDFALKKPELKDSFMDYLKKVCKETNIEKEVALTEDSESKDKKVIK